MSEKWFLVHELDGCTDVAGRGILLETFDTEAEAIAAGEALAEADAAAQNPRQLAVLFAGDTTTTWIPEPAEGQLH